MIFASLTFLTVFLPATLGFYFLADRRWHNAVLLTASLIFYSWGSGRYVLILVFTSAVAFLGGRMILRSLEPAVRRRWLIASVALTLAPLVYFKYAAFFSDIVADLAGVIGLDLPRMDDQALPIGISFFTFQAISYIIDVSHRDAPPARDFRHFLLYVSLFPQLIAGPIVRYSIVAEQLNDRSTDVDRVAAGLRRFVYGLGKKVLIADSVASIVDAVYGTDDISTTAAWFAALAYAVQIYFDFSGYSDMAIGLGMIFGFGFPENFKRPYSSLSITEFWRRWHITLSSWFRDYVYIPLGGSRGGTARTYFNLCLVFFLTALWHGAAWTFLVWGGLHAVAMVIERLTGRNHIESAPIPWLARGRTILLVILFWVPFRATSLDEATTVLRAMLWPSGLTMDEQLIAALTLPNLVALTVGLSIVFAPRDWSGLRTLTAGVNVGSSVRRTVTTSVVLLACLGALATGSLSPFLYFQF